MQNFSLLKRAGRARKPVLLKRGMSATLEEFLMAAEYIMSEGNYNVILCERGVRTFADHTRNTLDLSVVPAVQRLSHLPIIVDPSHGTGKRNKVTPLSRAAVAVGADGLIVEVHPDPDKALSDGNQSLFPDQFDELMREVRQIAAVLGRSIARTDCADARPVAVRHAPSPVDGRRSSVSRYGVSRAAGLGPATSFCALDGGLPPARGAQSRVPRVRLRHQRQERFGQRHRRLVAQYQDDRGGSKSYRCCRQSEEE